MNTKLARHLLCGALTLGGLVTIINCGGSDATTNKNLGGDDEETPKKKSKANDDDDDNKSSNNNQQQAAPPPVDAGPPRDQDAGTTQDASKPTPPSSGACSALNTCCAQLSSLTDRIACIGAVFAKNDTACLAATALYCNNPGGIFGNKTACQRLNSCCQANQYIANDYECKVDAKGTNQQLCSDDLYWYQTNPWQDCKEY